MNSYHLHQYMLWFLFILTTVITIFENLWFFQDVVLNPEFEATVKVFASKIAPEKIYALFWGAYGLFMIKWFGALLMVFEKNWGYFLYLVPNVLAILLAIAVLVVFKTFNWQPLVLLVGTIIFLSGYTYLYIYFKKLKKTRGGG